MFNFFILPSFKRCSRAKISTSRAENYFIEKCSYMYRFNQVYTFCETIYLYKVIVIYFTYFLRK